MAATTNQNVPTVKKLPATLPRDGAIEIELEQGVLIFRVSHAVQNRIEMLLGKQRENGLTRSEEQELMQYEDVDDYLSFLNRLIRNLAQAQQQGMVSAS
jgi:hypothetical protein